MLINQSLAALATPFPRTITAQIRHSQSELDTLLMHGFRASTKAVDSLAAECPQSVIE